VRYHDTSGHRLRCFMRRALLTHFTATTNPHVRIDALCFGTPARSYHQRGRTIHEFRPGQIFGVVWWRWYAGDQQHRTLAILEVPRARGEGDSVLDVQPAVIVHVFMDQYGPAGQERSVDHMLDLIHNIRDRGIEPATIAAKYWRRASRRILLGQRPPKWVPGDISNQEQSA
jgi:hypothetical protein